MSKFNEAAYLIANPDVALAVKNKLIPSGLDHYLKFGKAENRKLVENNKSRRDMALDGLSLKGKGLEIGPSINPIAPKSAGYDVEILDHLSASALKEKYLNHGVDISVIEEVDYVWSGEKIVDLVGKKNYYDWIIASHVIEHVPDFIQFLNDCQELLKPGGKLSLVIPDMRYCFDFFGWPTMTGALIDAFEANVRRPTKGQVFDSYVNSCSLANSISWDSASSGEIKLLHEFDVAKNLYKQASAGEYVDAHCWRFIPNSFRLLMLDLQCLDFTNMEISGEYDTCGCEFFFTLKAIDEMPNKSDWTADKRFSLLSKIKNDLRQIHL